MNQLAGDARAFGAATAEWEQQHNLNLREAGRLSVNAMPLILAQLGLTTTGTLQKTLDAIGESAGEEFTQLVGGTQDDRVAAFNAVQKWVESHCGPRRMESAATFGPVNRS